MDIVTLNRTTAEHLITAALSHLWRCSLDAWHGYPPEGEGLGGCTPCSR